MLYADWLKPKMIIQYYKIFSKNVLTNYIFTYLNLKINYFYTELYFELIVVCHDVKCIGRGKNMLY